MLHLLMVAGAAAGDAALSAPTSPVAPGEPVSFSFVLDGTSWLDGCSPVELERQEGEQWVALARRPCTAGPPATAVEGALVLSVPPPEVGSYRGVVSFGTGCQPARSFAAAACKELGFVRSAPFTVAAPRDATP